MDVLLGQIFSSLPVGLVLLILLLLQRQTVNDCCRKIRRLDDLLMRHITDHPGCGPEDDEGDEEDED